MPYRFPTRVVEKWAVWAATGVLLTCLAVPPAGASPAKNNGNFFFIDSEYT